MWSFQIHEHSMYFYLFRSLIFLVSVFWFSTYRLCTYFGIFISMYVNVLNDCIKKVILVSNCKLLTYRNSVTFWMLTFYITALLNSLISSKRFFFFIDYLGFPVTLSANRVIFISSFPIQMPFMSYSCLIFLAKIFSMLLNRSGENGNLCLFTDLWRKAFSLSAPNKMLAVGFYRYSLPNLGNFLLVLVC